MEKSFLNFFYWIFVKSAENYFGNSMQIEVCILPIIKFLKCFGIASIKLILYEPKLLLIDINGFSKI